MKGKAEKKAQTRLEEKFGSRYLEIQTNIVHPDGEIDFMGKRPDGKWDIYEIKATNRRKLVEKAWMQLDRAKRYLGQNCGDLFLYIGDQDVILPESF